mgnify:CR=1 FL=1
MAEYIPINPSEIEPEAPLTSSLASRWTNNPIAIAEGAPGAPRIQTNAIANGAVTAAKLATGTQERNWVLSRIAAAPLGAVGTYASLVIHLAPNELVVRLNEGDTRPGSGLRWSTTSSGVTPSSTSPSGTWMCMGRAATVRLDEGESRSPSLWLRIA